MAARILIPTSIVEQARRDAQNCYNASRAMGANATTFSGDVSGKTYSLEGVIAELFVQHLTRSIFGNVKSGGGSFKQERDYGPIEIQTSNSPNKRLILRESDLAAGVPADTPYLFVPVWFSVDNWYGMLKGWYRLGEGLNHSDKDRLEYKNDYNGPAWLLANRVLREISELETLYNFKFYLDENL